VILLNYGNMMKYSIHKEVRLMELIDIEGRERLMNDTDFLREFIKDIKVISKKQLDDLMCDYISDHNIDNEDDIRVIRQFVKFLKEQ